MRKIYKVGVIGTGDISTQYLTNAKNVIPNQRLPTELFWIASMARL